MITEIKTKKLLLKEKSKGMHREIVEIKNVEPIENLPTEYTKTGPAYWLENEGRMIIKTETGKETSLTVGDIVREQHFQALIKIMAKAGDRYTQINKKYKQWSGEEVVSI